VPTHGQWWSSSLLCSPRSNHGFHFAFLFFWLSQSCVRTQWPQSRQCLVRNGWCIEQDLQKRSRWPDCMTTRLVSFCCVVSSFRELAGSRRLRPILGVPGIDPRLSAVPPSVLPPLMVPLVPWPPPPSRSANSIVSSPGSLSASEPAASSCARPMGRNSLASVTSCVSRPAVPTALPAPPPRHRTARPPPKMASKPTGMNGPGLAAFKGGTRRNPGSLITVRRYADTASAADSHAGTARNPLLGRMSF